MKEYCSLYDSVIGLIEIKWNKRGITAINRKQKESCSIVEIPPEYKELLDSFFEFKKNNYKIKLNLKERIIYINRIPFLFNNTPESHIKIYYNLLKIKTGHTVSYGDLAQKSGYPGAARVCGTAMAQNPFSYIIPCHRVILASGKAGNYGGGSELKKKLLDLEGAL